MVSVWFLYAFDTKLIGEVYSKYVENMQKGGRG